MAEVGVTAQQNPPVTNKNMGTAQTHGLVTPENTPEPEDARIKAEKARRQAAQNANAPQNPASTESGSKPEDKSGGDGGKSEEDTGRSKEQTNDGGKSAATGDAATTGNEPPRNDGGMSAATGDAATTGNEPPGNGDEMDTEKTTPRPARTSWHLDAYGGCAKILTLLLDQPENTILTNQLDVINNSIR